MLQLQNSFYTGGNMAVILLKNLTDKINILEQQNSVLAYAAKNRISIELTEIETSDSSKSLESRGELKGFLRSLNPDETILVYDFWVFSSHIDELVKILECLLRRNITLHVVNKKTVIDTQSTPLHILSTLAKERQVLVQQKEKMRRGRPTGRMSQSKFDRYRSEIIEFLEDGYSVSKIASKLNVSRTSLKDYVNSRNLKTLAKTKKELLGATPKQISRKNRYKKKCDLIAEDTQ